MLIKFQINYQPRNIQLNLSPANKRINEYLNTSAYIKILIRYILISLLSLPRGCLTNCTIENFSDLSVNMGTNNLLTDLLAEPGSGTESKIIINETLKHQKPLEPLKSLKTLKSLKSLKTNFSNFPTRKGEFMRW